jgi:hypothetical protein
MWGGTDGPCVKVCLVECGVYVWGALDPAVRAREGRGRGLPVKVGVEIFLGVDGCF